jgi:hypothetical protein
MVDLLRSSLTVSEILPELILELGEAKIGTLPKDKPSGKIVDEWNQACVSRLRQRWTED